MCETSFDERMWFFSKVFSNLGTTEASLYEKHCQAYLNFSRQGDAQAHR